MSLETVLTYAFSTIGVLLSMLIALVIYVFISLKSEVVKVSTEVGDLSKSRVKLVHKDECRDVLHRINTRLDEVETSQNELNQRMIRVETKLELLGEDT